MSLLSELSGDEAGDRMGGVASATLPHALPIIFHCRGGVQVTFHCMFVVLRVGEGVGRGGQLPK